jgi:hypothetical protein
LGNYINYNPVYYGLSSALNYNGYNVTDGIQKLA